VRGLISSNFQSTCRRSHVINYISDETSINQPGSTKKEARQWYCYRLSSVACTVNDALDNACVLQLECPVADERHDHAIGQLHTVRLPCASGLDRSWNVTLCKGNRSGTLYRWEVHTRACLPPKDEFKEHCSKGKCWCLAHAIAITQAWLVC